MEDKLLKSICSTLFLAIICMTSANGQIPDSQSLDSTQLMTLSSLKKLNENMYLMHYKADYHFDSFMDVGTGDMSFDDFTKQYLDKTPADEPWACSAFMAKNSRITMVGRNFDWENIPGMILFTSPDSAYRSVSMVPIDLLLDEDAVTPEQNKTLLWAPYFPVEGINERGLVVMELAVEGEKVQDQSLVSMLSLQLTRLLLDYTADLDEAIDMLCRYNNSASERIHFFIADSMGNSAVIEYVDNAMVVSRNDGPWQVVTNTMISGSSEKKLRKLCGRYNYLSKYLEAHNRSLLEPGALNLLRAVAVDRVISSQYKITVSTQWSVVYNLPEKSLSVVSRRNFAKQFSYSLVE